MQVAEHLPSSNILYLNQFPSTNVRGQKLIWNTVGIGSIPAPSFTFLPFLMVPGKKN